MIVRVSGCPSYLSVRVANFEREIVVRLDSIADETRRMSPTRSVSFKSNEVILLCKELEHVWQLWLG